MSFSLSKKKWLLQTVRPLADKVVYVPLKWVAHTTLCLLGTHIGTARAPLHSAITVNCRPIYFLTPDMARRRLKSRGSESSYSARESGAGRYSGILMRTGLFMAARCLNHSPPPPLRRPQMDLMRWTWSPRYLPSVQSDRWSDTRLVTSQNVTAREEATRVLPYRELGRGCRNSGTCAQQTRHVKPMPIYCWADVGDGGPTLNRQWFEVTF